MSDMGLIERTSDGYRLPGLVDAHVHIESSHLCPHEFGRLLAMNGTFAAVCDPHEIVNVAGEEGLSFMLDDARRSPAQLFFSLPSCVPATAFETSGARLDAAATERLFVRYPELVALGEMMDYPSVIARAPDVMKKIRAALSRGKRVDGHFPGGSGELLRKYAAAGVTSDHETATAEEAREKIAAGLTVFIREGSSARNLAALLPAVTDDNWERFCFCTDDLSAADLAQGRGILDCVRQAVRLGMDPERAVAIASVNAVRHYGLPVDSEACVIVRDLVDFEIIRTVPPHSVSVGSSVTAGPSLRDSVHLPDLGRLSFPDWPAGVRRRTAIGVKPTELVTERASVGPDDAFLRLAVVERHGINGNIAFAPVVGAGPFHGALASSIGHDSHNIIVMGDGDADMRLAVARLGEIGGGATVVADGCVRADLRLPIGGLMSEVDALTVAAADEVLRRAVRTLGCTLPEPLTTLSFLALPVIPHLRLTDRGLFDVDAISDRQIARPIMI